jgi:MFS family permease
MRHFQEHGVFVCFLRLLDYRTITLAISDITRIVCRAFQGIGGSGLYTLSQVTIAEYGPTHSSPLVGIMIGVTLALALVIGPIVGGLISRWDWTWIFSIKYAFSYRFP